MVLKGRIIFNLTPYANNVNRDIRLTTCLSFGICINVSDEVFYRDLVTRVPISFSYTVNTNEVMVTDSDRIRMMLSSI